MYPAILDTFSLLTYDFFVSGHTECMVFSRVLIRMAVDLGHFSIPIYYCCAFGESDRFAVRRCGLLHRAESRQQQDLERGDQSQLTVSAILTSCNRMTLEKLFLVS